MSASPPASLRMYADGLAAAAVGLRGRVMALSGWRRWCASLAAGAASALAMAPFYLFPVLWLTLPVLLWLIEASGPGRDAASPAWWRRALAQPGMRAAGIGWLFAFGYFFAGLFWIGLAFLVEAQKFAVLLPVAVTVMPAGLALFWAAATGLTRLPDVSPLHRVVSLTLTLSAAEYLRGHILTGFPWNLLGYALTWPLPLMQGAAFVGVYALTFVAVLIFTAPLVIWADALVRGQGVRGGRLALALALGPILVLGLAGAARLAGGPAPNVDGPKLRIVQPSIPQREKWLAHNQERIFLEHLKLSGTNSAGVEDKLAGITHVLWPEAAMPFLPLEQPVALRMIGEMLPQGVQLIAGAIRVEPTPPGSPRARRIFNSILVFGGGGALVARYDKIHLVPFGEYLPLQNVLEAIGLEQLTRMRGGFDSGDRPRPLMRLTGLPPIGPLVCYEAIFPGATVQGAERPGLLVNLTNDGWFGDTTGPRQHFHQARVRAVEEGVPLVRAANNGISAAFDAYGRELGRIGFDVRGTLDVPVPQAISPPPYARFGDLFFFIFWAGTAGWIAWVIRSRGTLRAGL